MGFTECGSGNAEFGTLWASLSATTQHGGLADIVPLAAGRQMPSRIGNYSEKTSSLYLRQSRQSLNLGMTN